MYAYHGRLKAGAATILLCAVMTMVLAGGCGKPQSKAGGKRVVVVGFDGLDPRQMRRMLDEGRLPNFKKLSERGCFSELGTSIPPQSPVAWSNFITGADPGAHGIFDFVHRDAEKQTDYDSPFFSANKMVEGDRPTIILNHVVWMPGQKRPEVILTRGGKPFWSFLDENDIPAWLYRIPANYPPTRAKRGHVRCLAGMGTPDITGSQGTFQWFSPDFDEDGTKNPGGGTTLPMEEGENGHWICKLQGTGNPVRVEWTTDPQTGERDFHHPMMEIELVIEPDREHDIAQIRYTNAGWFGMESEQELLLHTGEWSDWQHLVFPTSWIHSGFPATARFWLRRVHPYPELYVTPINFDPSRPQARVSEPESFVTEIGADVGLFPTGMFYTQGFAEDFKALDANVADIFGDRVRLFDAEAYRVQAQQVFDERAALLDYALKHYDDGLLFFYFSSSDLMAHMFWWNPEMDGLDPDAEHPTRSSEEARKYHRVIEGLYEQCDKQLGKVMDAMEDEATIMAMSDHGFGPFQRKVNLNTWLYQNGFITLKRGAAKTGRLSQIANWSKTKAYSIGLNGIYVNLRGREREGSVTPDERDALLEDIREKLLASKDPKTGKPVVLRVYRTDEVYHGPYAPGGIHDEHTADLIVGYHLGYITRTGTMGSITKNWLYDNRGEWSADHCIAAELTPGVLFSNRKVIASDPELTDLAPTILAEFGIPKPDCMTGRNIFGPKDEKRTSAGE